MTTSLAETATPVQAAAPLADLRPLCSDDGGPIRAELFGPESLEAYARRLASWTATTRPLPGCPMLRRFEDNGRVLELAHERLLALAATRQAEPLSPEAEWLLDNYYVVADALREVRQDLPGGYYRELPKLPDGPLAGFPRVYALALGVIAHTDSTLDEGQLGRFVRAFQGVTLLTIGELWAVPIMLRLALLENLRRLAERMLSSKDERARADEWVARCIGLSPAALPPLPTGALSPIFLARAWQTLRERADPETAKQFEAELARGGWRADDLGPAENRRQALNQVSVGNCVTSLRLLSATDWNVFFESVSRTESLLRQDPAGAYARQDFATRDRYRRAVEKLARRSGRAEEAVALHVLRLAGEASAAGPQAAPRDHVGYYLLGDGRAELRSDLGYRPDHRDRLEEALRAHGCLVYCGGIGALTALILAALACAAWACGGGVMLVPLLLLALPPASAVATAVVNYALALLLPPSGLPRLELKEGIPPDCSTFVVMPCLLARRESADELLQRLEIHYLANPDPQLRFALLTDFTDAPTEHQPGDDGCLRAALDGVAELNRRHAAGPPRFFLFHRGRRWNPAQGCWMGWERKRGKLSEFNRLLRGDRGTTYEVCSDDPAKLPPIRFVITLDADTRLPRDTARRLVGTLAHPLNRPRFDPVQGRVVAGYGVLQPRVSFHLEAANRSLFSRIRLCGAGVDPYAATVSDVYQDLFGTGIFTGKGVYDVDAFEAATGRTFPENHILSHDLIEGNYARCGLVTDVELFDDYPARYHSHARREHRWVRGDWQLLPWLGRTVPAPGGRVPNPLPLLERWKVLDNLRRSLTSPALVALLVLGWTVLPGSSWLWTILALAVLGGPLWLQLFGILVTGLRDRRPAALSEPVYRLPSTAGGALLDVVFLADQARLTLDAIVRTLGRLVLTRRRLLEWESAAATEQRLGAGLAHFCRSMGATVLLTAACAVLVGLVRPVSLSQAAPFLGAWLLSPLWAYLVSRPRSEAKTPLRAHERRELRCIARRTWGFFEAFVGEQDHWLPPDNFQEVPEPKVAHRTSPTNKGLLLLSTLAAHDFGYIGPGALTERLEKTFAALDRLERYRGHFFNWYDTRTLKPLQPSYVSTVDSGNFVGCLIALKQGLKEVVREPWPGQSLPLGLADALAVVEEQVRGDGVPVDRMRPSLAALRRLLRQTPADLPAWLAWLGQLSVRAAELTAAVPAEPDLGAGLWVRRFADQIAAARTELERLAPWLGLLDCPEAGRFAVLLSARSPQAVRRWEEVRRRLTTPFSPDGLETQREGLLADLTALRELLHEQEDGTAALWLEKLTETVGGSVAGELRERCLRLAERADGLALATDFSFLYKPDRHLFAIGYTPLHERLDASSYDLLASEARLASFLAIARGDAPGSHWFNLGRLVTRCGGDQCLVSWGGTMFEYLMPELLLPCYPGTLLVESRRAAVARQIEYGRRRCVPWGISESAFARYNADADYCYQTFGVPGLGLKRGLGRELVIAPYATALAATVRPRAALLNFRRLAAEGGVGAHGFYEALDYTPARLPAGSRSVTVRCFMAHHQGMSLVALANCLLDNPMPRRFAAEPMARAVELLLQERVPRAAQPLDVRDATKPSPVGVASEEPGLVSRRLTTAATPAPRTHLLSNGRYAVMITNAGSGYAVCNGLDVTRWREDFTRDCWGQFHYVRDLESGTLWSAGFQPVCRVPNEYEVVFSADKADFRRLDDAIATHLEVTVAPERDAEVRRVTLTNTDSRTRHLEVASYGEVVLGRRGADQADVRRPPAEAEWVPQGPALLFHRRPGGTEEEATWAVHVLAADDDDVTRFETDRGRFPGRWHPIADPAGPQPEAEPPGNTGPLADPIFSLCRRVRLRPGASVTLSFTTAVAASREEALALADHYRDPQAVQRAFELAWAHCRLELRHLRLTAEDMHAYQRLGAYLLYAGPFLRGQGGAAATCNDRFGAWRSGLSGERPLLLVSVGERRHLALVRELLRAHAYWRLRLLEVNLVIWNEEPATSGGGFRSALQGLLSTGVPRGLAEVPGGVFLRHADQLPAGERRLLEASARVVLCGAGGSLARQLDQAEPPPAPPPDLVPRIPDVGSGPVRTRTTAPAPSSNELTNGALGFLVSETGCGFTWVGDCRANRLTSCKDQPGEVIYLLDEQGCRTPTPLPLGAAFATESRHDPHRTVFEQTGSGLTSRLTLFLAPDDPVKIMLLDVRNLGSNLRRLTAAFYAEWVLGGASDQAAPIATTVDAESGALLARRYPFSEALGGRLAFAFMNLRPLTVTADRTEFLGRNGSVFAPVALSRVGLSGRVGTAPDTCAAFHAPFELPPGAEQSVVILLGVAPDDKAVRRFCRRYAGSRQALAALLHAGSAGLRGERC